MAIFDKELNHIDPQNVEQSLKTLENYISYMRERLEFNNSNLTRTLSSTGTSTAEIVLILAALQNNVQAMQSSITAIQGQITTLETTVSGLNSSVQTLSGNVTAVQGTVSTLQSNVSALQDAVAALQTAVQNIDQRVTALEAKGGDA